MKMLLLLTALCTTTAFANNNFDLGIGATFPQTNTSFNNDANTDIAGFFNYRYSTSERWSFGAGLYHLSFSDTDLNDEALYFLSRYELSTSSKINPFLIVGLGAANISPDNGHDYARGSAMIGAGIDTNINDCFRVGLNLNYHHVGKFDSVATEQHTLVPSLSFTYAPKAKHSHHSHNKKAAQMKDADKDGIADNHDACPDTAPNATVNKVGCDISKKDLNIALDVKFLTGKSAINESSTAKVDKLANFLKANKDVRVEIQGHTDSSGARALNMSISERRARAVKAYLIVKHGISAERLEAKGYGPDMPVSSNDSYQGRLANRRVEAKVLSN